MADSSVSITEGSGLSVDSRTESTNGNHRQVIVIGDPATNAGVAPVDVTNGLAVQVIPALPAGTNAIGKLAANSGVDIGDVDVTSIAPGTAASSLGKAEDGAHTTGDVGVMALGVANEANTARAADSDYIPLAVDTEGNVRTVGNRDHDAIDAGEPVKIGAKAETSPKGITLVADADRTDLLADSDGMLMVKMYTSGADNISERVSNTDGNSTAFSTFDNAANTRNYITSVIVHNAHASTNGYVDLRDGTAGSIIATFPLPANGGTAISFPVPLRQPTAATALAYDVSAAITTIYITIIGFKSKV